MRRVVRGALLALRSRGAGSFVLAAVAALAVAWVLGPHDRQVMLREGLLQQPIPLVLAAVGAALCLCLGSPHPDLEASLPRTPVQVRTLTLGFCTAVAAVVAVAGVVQAPELLPAVVRTMALTGTLTVGLAMLVPPVLTWLPVGSYLLLSWIWGKDAETLTAHWWALPVQWATWGSAALWVGVFLATATVWLVRGARS